MTAPSSEIASASASTSGRLWAVTAYFNPVGFASRRENFRLFRARLEVPLVAVELGYRDRFELGPGDAEGLIQLHGEDLLWQKERLLALAIAAVPASCDVVAWLDCDVALEAGWPARALRALDAAALVQPFSRLVHLRRGELPEGAAPAALESTRRSFCHAYSSGALPKDIFRHPRGTGEARCTCGMAWVARRELLERHGLYDAMILGMGDKQVAAAAVGRAEDAALCMEMSPAHAAHYLRWAARFHADVRGRVGAVEGAAAHLWHGNLANRRYVERYRGFGDLGFDPGRDLALDASGAWRWSAAASPALRERVGSYFAARREDGDEGELAATPAAARAT